MNEKKGSPRGPKPVIQWMLHIEGGRTLGPLKTEEVLFRISEGILSGNEKIKKHPDGQWTFVSREPVFYDQLLEALQKTVDDNKLHKDNKIKSVTSQQEFPDENVKNTEDEVVQMPIAKKKNADILKPLEPISKNPPDFNEVEQTQTEGLSQNLHAAPLNVPVIVGKKAVPSKLPPMEQKSPLPPQINEMIPSKRDKKFIISPKYFFLGALVLLMSAFLTNEILKPKSSYIKLRFPKVNTKTTIDESKQKRLLETAFQKYYLDQTNSYLEAQNVLIELIESSPQLPQARGLLCLVHKELWPFAKQDSKDIDIFQLSRKGARLLDPVGENGVICEIIYLMVLGKFQNAMGLADHFTNNPNNEVSPFLYYIKSELYAADRKYKDAIAYANDVVTKIPNWAKPVHNLANYLEETNRLQEASEKFSLLFKLNPKHRSGLIDYGSMIYSKTQNVDESFRALNTADKLESRINKSNEAKMHFYLAKIYENKKNHDKALDHAVLAFQLNPSDVHIRDLLISLGGSPKVKPTSDKNNELVFLGDQYYRAGDCLSAQAEYKAAFEFDPQNAMAATKAARCVWQLSQVQSAFELLAQAIQADPKLSWSYYLMADYYSQRFNFNEAAQVLQKAAHKIPNNAEILKGFGLIEFRRNNFKEASKYLESSRKAFENDPDTLVLLAKTYSAKSPITDYEKALQMAIKAIELEDTNSEAHVTYANILVQTKGVESGAMYIKDLMKKYSYNLEFRLCLAQIYKETERYTDAKEVYEHVLLNDEKNKLAMIGLAESYQGLGQFTPAIQLFLKASALNPSDPEPVVKSGLVYLEANRVKQAITQFERARNMNPNYPRVNYMLGRAAFSVKEFSNAIKYVNLEKQFNPKLADPYLLAGEIYFEANEFLNCAKEYEAAIKLRPQGAENYVKLAVCHLRLGNLDVADSMLKLAEQQESGFAEIHKVQGEIFEKRGERDAALQSYRKYITLSPNAPDKKSYERRIEALGGGK